MALVSFAIATPGKLIPDITRLYIIEGLITIAWAGLTVFLVPKRSSSAYFLNDQDKAIMKIREEIMESYSGGTGHYTKEDVKLAAKDITTWVHAPTQVAMVTILYGFGTFLPIILKFSFDFSTLQTQYLVVSFLKLFVRFLAD